MESRLQECFTRSCMWVKIHLTPEYIENARERMFSQVCEDHGLANDSVLIDCFPDNDYAMHKMA